MYLEEEFVTYDPVTTVWTHLWGQLGLKFQILIRQVIIGVCVLGRGVHACALMCVCNDAFPNVYVM